MNRTVSWNLLAVLALAGSPSINAQPSTTQSAANAVPAAASASGPGIIAVGSPLIVLARREQAGCQSETQKASILHLPNSLRV